jgi:methylase of polypeptide subunit release factors
VNAASPGSFSWRTESDDPSPAKWSAVDDRLTAMAATARARRGEYLLYTGDYRNASQLVAAMGRRVKPSREKASTPLAAYRAEREVKAREHRLLSHVLVSLDGEYGLGLRHAPDVAQACRWAWGEPAAATTVVPLKLLQGVLGAAEWYRKGVAVPGLEGRIHPHYGVFFPARAEYAALLARIPSPKGKRAFDVGTGTGVLSFLLLQRGAATVQATDVEPRAVACARDNAQRLGLAGRFEAEERPLFPEGTADLVVCNPPWIPEPPKSRLDRAIFDPDLGFLHAFIEGLPAHLSPGGRGYLLLSNLAELLGLRRPELLPTLLGKAGLSIEWKEAATAQHPRARDPDEPLHAWRSQEATTLYCLAPTDARG